MSPAESPKTLASPVLMGSDELAACTLNCKFYFVFITKTILRFKFILVDNSSPFLDNNVDFVDLRNNSYSTIVDDEQG
jgi:hypothetical protein